MVNVTDMFIKYRTWNTECPTICVYHLLLIYSQLWSSCQVIYLIKVLTLCALGVGVSFKRIGDKNSVYPKDIVSLINVRYLDCLLAEGKAAPVCSWYALQQWRTCRKLSWISFFSRTLVTVVNNAICERLNDGQSLTRGTEIPTSPGLERVPGQLYLPERRHHYLSKVLQCCS